MSVLQIAARLVAVAGIIAWAFVVMSTAVFAVDDREVDPLLAAFLSVVVIVGGFVAPMAAIILIFGLPEGLRRRESPAATGYIHSQVDASPATAPVALAEPLSQRELEVLRLLEGGGSNKEIAAALVIEVGTVKTHTNNIYRKLGAKNRTHALDLGRKAGLL